MVENGKEIIKQSTFTHMRAHIRVPDYILSPSRRPCLSHLPYNTPSRFKNKYSAFPFPRSHSRRGYISGLFFNMSTLSWVLDYKDVNIALVNLTQLMSYLCNYLLCTLSHWYKWHEISTGVFQNQIRTWCPIPDLFRTIFGTLVRIRTKSGIPDLCGPSASHLISLSASLPCTSNSYLKIWNLVGLKSAKLKSAQMKVFIC